MGLQLKGVASRRVAAQDLAGKVVAIDAPNVMYAFYAVQMLRAASARDAALRSATRGLAQRIADLDRRGARCVVIFDGPPHALKLRMLEARDSARTYPAIGSQDYAWAREAARALGAPVVEAPHDAEAQASAMARAGVVDVVATTDWDALAMGAPRLLRNLSARPDATEGRCWSLVDAAEALALLSSSREHLATAAVLMGCDYFDGFPRVGPQKAMKLATLGLDAALVELRADADTAAHARAAYQLLVEPPHRDVALRWGAPDAEALRRALAGETAPNGRAAVQTRL